MASEGSLSKISGPVVQATGMQGAQINELVKVGDMQLVGEIIALRYDRASVQVYEDTNGLRPGERVVRTGMPLSVELAPGLLSGIFDGTQRPLEAIMQKSGNYIQKGISVNSLDRKKKWEFEPTAKKGDKVRPGDILGTVKENEIEHRVMVPAGVEGTVTEIEKGSFTITDTIATIGKTEVGMLQRWPVRVPRKYIEKLRTEQPLITGKRIVDTFFPIARGGVAAIPGPFGSGKCVSGGTPILMADGTTKTMEELHEYCRKNGESTQTVFEETIELRKPLEVLSFDGNRLTKKESRVFYKGKSDSLYRIRTRSGKVLEVTPVHKLFKVTSELQIEETQAQCVKAGEFIAGVRKIPETREAGFDVYKLEKLRVVDEEVRDEVKVLLANRARLVGIRAAAGELGFGKGEFRRLLYKASLPTLAQVKRIYGYYKMPLPKINKVRGDRRGAEATIPTEMAHELAEFLGLFVAEGYIRGGRTAVFTNKDEKLLKRFAGLSEGLFGVKARIERQEGKTANVLVASRALVEYLKSVGAAGNASEKRVPSVVASSSNDFAGSFLKAYFLGDGSFSDGEVEFTTASSSLRTGIAYLLARYGILCSLAERKINGKAYYRVFVRGAPNLEALLDLFLDVNDEKIAKIRGYLKDEREASRYYTATDVVPASPRLLEAAYQEAGRPYALLKQNGVEITNYTKNAERMSAAAFKRFAAVLSETAAGKQKQFQLSALTQFAKALDWIHCDEIVSVEELQGPHDVYDISVPGTENWVGGNSPMLFHNTVTQQDLAKYADADVIVYIGCGERGNEMTDVLVEFPKLLDPKNKKPLMNRTVLIANTSNMPVAAREASIYTGITIAEYYRDMGYSVALMADSTSRWAEAMREISGRMEEMPGEEGYPAYLAKKLAEFYERAGSVQCMASKPRFGSISVIGAVSPPGGDISEPVSQATLRVTKVFWALDANLSRRRHYPAINWLKSYSLYLDDLEKWYLDNVASDFYDVRGRAMALLQEEAELQNIVQLIGPDALPDKQRLVLEATKMIREDFLQQNSYDEIDVYSTLKKQHALLKTILQFYDKASNALAVDVPFEKIQEASQKQGIAALKRLKDDEFNKSIAALNKELESAFAK